MRSTATSHVRLAVLALCGAALISLGGCASTKITDQDSYQGPELARPGLILVHDFATTPADLPAWADEAQGLPGPTTPPSQKELESGRQLGMHMAEELVEQIQAMGMPAARATDQTTSAVGDIEIVGYFVSFDAGSAAKRIALGFGSGAAKLTTEVEGYLKTADGMRKLGSGEAGSGAGKSPGMLASLAITAATHNPVGLIVGGAVKVGDEATGKTTLEGVAKTMADKIAQQLEVKFREQGWIEASS